MYYPEYNCISLDGYLYAIHNNGYQIAKISLSNPLTDYNLSWSSAYNNLRYIAYYNGFFYGIDSGTSCIVKIDVTDGTYTTWLNMDGNSLSLNSLTIYNNVLYFSELNYGQIYSVSMSGGPASVFIDLSGAQIWGMVAMNGILYVNFPFPYGSIGVIDINSATVINTTWKTGYSINFDLIIHNDKIYVSDAFANNVYSYNLYITGFNGPIGMAFDTSGIFYVCNYEDGSIVTVDTTTLQPNGLFLQGGILPSPYYGMVIDTSFMYVCMSDNGTVARINIVTPSDYDLQWISGLSRPNYILIDGDYLYVSNESNDGIISQINKIDGTISNLNWAVGVSYITGMAIYNGNIIVGGTDGLYTVPLSTGGTVVPFTSFIGNTIYGVSIVNGIIYVNNDTQALAIVDAGSGTIINSNYYNFTESYNLITYGNKIYVSDYGNNIIYSYNLYNVVCFLEGTQILCYSPEHGEHLKLIEDIEQGDLVKTYKHGYKAVHTIGSGKVYNPGDNSRTKDRLYSVNNKLVVTGCHALLVDTLTDQQRNKIIELFGKVYVTDDLYRLMVCIDKEPYNKEGVFNIWHFSLENSDSYMNYGIWANGILAETSSKRMMKEYSSFQFKLK